VVDEAIGGAAGAELEQDRDGGTGLVTALQELAGLAGQLGAGDDDLAGQ
jgi:hypothetical protein